MSHVAVRRQRQIKRRVGRHREYFIFALLAGSDGKAYAVVRDQGLAELEADHDALRAYLEKHTEFKFYGDQRIALHKKATLSDVASLTKYFEGIVPTISLVPA